MDSSKILKSDYLDILFEGRNKSYGGYELRKKYPERARKAALIIGAVVLLAVAYPVIAGIIGNSLNSKQKLSMKEVTLAEPPPIDKTKPPPPPPPPVPPPPVKPTVQFTPPVIKKDEEVKEEEKPATVKELEKASAGVETKEGDPNGIDPGIMDKGTGNVVEAAPSTPLRVVSQMPEFNGDINSWLNSHLRYPESAREAGTEGRVIVEFVVNEDGAITDVKVVRSSGSAELDAEGKRVVSSMPNWKPGRQQGTAVKVYFSLPISFKLD